MTRRRLKATTAAPPNPTLTESQLAAEQDRRAEQERSAALAVCCHAVKARWHKDEAVQVLRMVIDRETLRRWGMAPDPVQSVPSKYAWGQVKQGAGQ